MYFWAKERRTNFPLGRTWNRQHCFDRSEINLPGLIERESRSISISFPTVHKTRRTKSQKAYDIEKSVERWIKGSKYLCSEWVRVCVWEGVSEWVSERLGERIRYYVRVPEQLTWQVTLRVVNTSEWEQSCSNIWACDNWCIWRSFQK